MKLWLETKDEGKDWRNRIDGNFCDWESCYEKMEEFVFRGLPDERCDDDYRVRFRLWWQDKGKEYFLAIGCAGDPGSKWGIPPMIFDALFEDSEALRLYANSFGDRVSPVGRLRGL